MSALREIAAHFGVSFDTAALKEGGSQLDGLVEKVKGFAGSLGAGLALGAIFHFVSGLTEEADALQKQADAMGLSLSEMQEWNYAAMMQGVSAETLAGTLAKLGSGKFDKGLADLKISTKDATGEMRNSTDILEDVADSLASIENPAERNRKAVAVLGKSYLKLLPLLQDGSKGIKELRQEFIDLGGGFTEDFAKKSDEFGDNVDRLKTVWKNFQIQVVGAVLPMLLTLVKRIVSLSKPVMALFKNSEMMKAGFIALAIKGVLFLSGKIGPLGTALKLLSKNFFSVILPLLILEDLLVFLAGGDSLLGRAIEKAFGKGTSDDVRKWINGVWKEVTGFFGDLKGNPQKLLDDWDVFTTQLGKDMRSLFGDTFGEMLGIAGGGFVGLIDMMTGGWDNFARKTGAIWDSIVLACKIVWTELEGGFVNLAAIIGDAFINAWNYVIGGLNSVLMKVESGLNKIGLMSDKEVADNKKTYASQQGVADLSETVNKARDMKRTALAAESDRIGQQWNQPAYAPQLTAQVNVTVPPGTPAQVAKNAGDAAKAGTQAAQAQNLKAAHAALKPGGV